MTISELIKQLDKLKDEHGDLTVCFQGEAYGDPDYISIESAEVLKNEHFLYGPVATIVVLGYDA
jgi:hypothetical protein